MEARYDEWYKESDAIVREVEKLRLKPSSTQKDLDRRTELEAELRKLKSRYSEAEAEAAGAFKTRVAQEFPSPLYRSSTVRSSRTCSSSSSGDFQLTPPQRFLRRYFSPQSDRTGILLFHGVGVGKTCTAITIAEDFLRSSPWKKVLVLCPLAVIDQFRSQIFDVKKIVADELKVVDVEASSREQCTRDFYVTGEETRDVAVLKHRIENRVRSRYDVETYHGIFKRVEEIREDAALRHGGAGTPAAETSIDARINVEFSNSLLIIDEVHNLRVSNNPDDQKSLESSEKKKASEALMRVVRCASNLRLVLLTATPMFNSAPEALWILNLLRVNAGFPLIVERDIFSADGRVSQSGLQKLATAATGFVSYVSSQDQDRDLFPRVIDAPAARGDPRRLEIDGVVLTASKLSEPQLGATLAKGLDMLEAYKPNNVFYPSSADEQGGDEEEERHNKIDSAFTSQIVGNGKIQYRYREDVTKAHGRCLAPANIARYATKIKTILDEIAKSPGIVFVFSRALEHGTIPLAIALEEHGYTRRFNSRMLGGGGEHDPQRHPQHSFKYAILSGTPESSDDKRAVLAEFSHPSNRDGSKIKVLVGSDILSEGIDLKNVRQVHVLEPWWHMNKIKQVVGRAARRCSHAALPDAERDVSVYLHATVLDSKNRQETNDVARYRLSVQKDEAIMAVESILKDTALDGCLYGSAVGCGDRRRPASAALNDYEEVGEALKPVLAKLLAGSKATRTLKEIADAPDVRNLLGKDAEQLLHASLTADKPTFYVPDARVFVPATVAHDVYLQLRERTGAWSRPSCEKTVFRLKARRSEAQELPDLDYILMTLKLQKNTLLSNIRNMFRKAQLGNVIATHLDRAAMDFCVDRMMHVEHTVVLQHYMSTKAKSAISLSMMAAGYIIGDFDYGYDYFDNVYFKHANDKLVKVDHYEYASVVAPIILANQSKLVASGTKLKGFMSFVGTNLPYEFKTSKVSFDGGWTRGTLCSSSIMDKDELVGLIESIDERVGNDDIDKSKASKQDLCAVIELLLRDLGHDAFTRCVGAPPPQPPSGGAAAPRHLLCKYM